VLPAKFHFAPIESPVSTTKKAAVVCDGGLFVNPWVLVNLDENPGTIVPGPPITVVIFVHDIRMMSAVVVPISILVMRPRIVVIIGQ